MRSALLLVAALIPHFTQAAEGAHPLGRYAYLTPGSTFAQRHPLQVTLEEARFPQEIATIGEAIDHLLARSGYELDRKRSRFAYSILLPQPLPEVHRNLGPIYLSEALSVLAGDAWRLTVNPLYRTVIIRPRHAWMQHLKRGLPQIEFEEAGASGPPVPVLPAVIPAEPAADLPKAVRAKGPGDPSLRPGLTGAPKGFPGLRKADSRITGDTQTADATEIGASEIPIPGSLHDHTEIFINEMALREILDLLVPEGWKLQPEVQPALLHARISMVSSSTWWDALTELARTLGAQTRSELQLHVFENQRLVVLEQL